MGHFWNVSSISLSIVISFVISALISSNSANPIIIRKNDPATLEAVKIILESTGELLPDPSKVEKVKFDLELIRFLDSSLQNVIHTGKWKPGELVTNEISDEQIAELHSSEFRPLKAFERNMTNTLLIFKKPYHPEKLADLLQLRFGIMSSPHYIPGREMGNKILYADELSTYYFNSKNGQDCESGCLAQFATSFNDEDQKNKL